MIMVFRWKVLRPYYDWLVGLNINADSRDRVLSCREQCMQLVVIVALFIRRIAMSAGNPHHRERFRFLRISGNRSTRQMASIGFWTVFFGCFLVISVTFRKRF